MRTAFRTSLGLMLTLIAASAHAQSSPDPTGGALPRVPVSAFARPAPWLDPSRLHVTQEFSFGTGFGGTSQGLSVTRFQYQLGQPLSMRVSVGNTFGAPGQQKYSPFLESFDLAYHPFNSLLVQVRYQDVRSPLQYSNGYAPYGWR